MTRALSTLGLQNINDDKYLLNDGQGACCCNGPGGIHQWRGCVYQDERVHFFNTGDSYQYLDAYELIGHGCYQYFRLRDEPLEGSVLIGRPSIIYWDSCLDCAPAPGCEDEACLQFGPCYRPTTAYQTGEVYVRMYDLSGPECCEFVGDELLLTPIQQGGCQWRYSCSVNCYDICGDSCNEFTFSLQVYCDPDNDEGAPRGPSWIIRMFVDDRGNAHMYRRNPDADPRCPAGLFERFKDICYNDPGACRIEVDPITLTPVPYEG